MATTTRYKLLGALSLALSLAATNIASAAATPTPTPKPSATPTASVIPTPFGTTPYTLNLPNISGVRGLGYSVKLDTTPGAEEYAIELRARRGTTPTSRVIKARYDFRTRTFSLSAPFNRLNLTTAQIQSEITGVLDRQIAAIPSNDPNLARLQQGRAAVAQLAAGNTSASSPTIAAAGAPPLPISPTPCGSSGYPACFPAVGFPRLWDSTLEQTADPANPNGAFTRFIETQLGTSPHVFVLNFDDEMHVMFRNRFARRRANNQAPHNYDDLRVIAVRATDSGTPGVFGSLSVYGDYLNTAGYYSDFTECPIFDTATPGARSSQTVAAATNSMKGCYAKINLALKFARFLLNQCRSSSSSPRCLAAYRVEPWASKVMETYMTMNKAKKALAWSLVNAEVATCEDLGYTCEQDRAYELLYAKDTIRNRIIENTKLIGDIPELPDSVVQANSEGIPTRLFIKEQIKPYSNGGAMYSESIFPSLDPIRMFAFDNSPSQFLWEVVDFNAKGEISSFTTYVNERGLYNSRFEDGKFLNEPGDPHQKNVNFTDQSGVPYYSTSWFNRWVNRNGTFTRVWSTGDKPYYSTTYRKTCPDPANPGSTIECNYWESTDVWIYPTSDRASYHKLCHIDVLPPPGRMDIVGNTGYRYLAKLQFYNSAGTPTELYQNVREDSPEAKRCLGQTVFSY